MTLPRTPNTHALDLISLTSNSSASQGMHCFFLCRCRLTGSGRQLTVGQPVMLTLHTADAYSNACWDSADKVHVGLCGPPGTVLTAAAVENLRNGAYCISFTPDVAGRWTVLPRYHVQRLAIFATACCLGMAQNMTRQRPETKHGRPYTAAHDMLWMWVQIHLWTCTFASEPAKAQHKLD